MQNILLAVHVVVAVLLVISVLLQRSEGGGLGIGGNAGGNAKAASQGGLDGLQKLTWALGLGFIATSLTLVIISTRDIGATSSLLDSLDGLDAGATIESQVTDGLPSAEEILGPDAIPVDPTQN